MCEWKQFCEFGDKGDDCDDPDFQNGCEQYWGFSRMDDDRFRREMTARREATKAGKKNLAEKVREAIREKFREFEKAGLGAPSRYAIEKAIHNTLNDGGD